ncbi:potassium transporter peripheral membrane component [compost metagenome]
MVAQFVPIKWALAITAWMAIVVGYVLAQRLQEIYQWFESRFLSNFREESTKNHAKKNTKTLAPWDAHITEFLVPAEAPYVGKPLISLSIREKFGVTVALIERGKIRITAPGRDEALMPHDRISVIGTDEQLVVFKSFIEIGDSAPVVSPSELGEYSLEQYLVTEHSPFLGKTIRDCGVRETTHGLVVGIERDGRRILNPDSADIIRSKDLLWIVGDQDKILSLK